jgi:hypothetical protein
MLMLRMMLLSLKMNILYIFYKEGANHRGYREVSASGPSPKEVNM